MIAVCGLSFMPMQSSFAAGAMPRAEEQTVEQKDTSKKTPPLDVMTTAINYKLINDSSETLSKDDINQISNDLNDIFDKMKALVISLPSCSLTQASCVSSSAAGSIIAFR